MDERSRVAATLPVMVVILVAGWLLASCASHVATVEVEPPDGPRVLVLKPGAEAGKDAFIEDYPERDYRNRNFGNMASFSAMAWTAQGIPLVVRSLIEFDLSSVPRDASVSSARLLLYHCVRESPSSGQFDGHSTLSGLNGGYLQRVVSEWDEMSVTWNTQPETTSEGQIAIPASTDPAQDYLIDVTQMVRRMIEDPSSNHGFMILLRDEDYYRRLTFASSDFEDPSLYPELVVHYTLRRKPRTRGM